MPDETHIIVNPDRSDAAAEIVDLADTVERPDGADELADAASRAADADIVAAVGGDGTQRTVAEAVAHRDASLVVVPAGTVNMLGRLHGSTPWQTPARRFRYEVEPGAVTLRVPR